MAGADPSPSGAGRSGPVPGSPRRIEIGPSSSERAVRGGSWRARGPRLV